MTASFRCAVGGALAVVGSFLPWITATAAFLGTITRSGLDGRGDGMVTLVGGLVAVLPRQRFHDLRHAYATLKPEAGEDIAVISKSLPHTNLSTTVDTYSHLTEKTKRRSADLMDAILGDAATD
jgi:integrase